MNRMPRSWGDAAELLRSRFDERFDRDARTRVRDVLQELNRGGLNGPSARGLPSGRGPGQAGLGNTIVPSAIRRGNPNIDRALNFDLAQTNPHAASLLAELQAGQGYRPDHAKGLAGGKAGVMKDLSGLSLSGKPDEVDQLVSSFRERERGAQATERETAWGRGPAGTLGPSPTSGVDDAMNTVFGERGKPDVEGIVGNVRRSLGEMGQANQGKSLAETLMADILGQTANRLGGAGTAPDVDSIVARIRDQTASAARPPTTATSTTVSGTAPPAASPFPAQGQGVGRTSAAGTGTLPTVAAPGQTGLTAAPGFEQTGARMNVTSPGPAGTTPGTGGGTLGSYGNASIDQWDAQFVAAGQKYGVDPTLLKAMMEVESGGDGNYAPSQCRSDGTGVDSCGPMQIKGIYHQSKCPSCDLSTTEGSIEMAAAILADYKAANPGATDKDALFAVYFTGSDPNGTDQGSYGARVSELQAAMGPYTPGAAPSGAPGTVPGPTSRQGPGPFPGAAAAPGSQITDAQGNVVGTLNAPQQPGAAPVANWPGSNALLPAPGTGMNAPIDPASGLPVPPAGVFGTLDAKAANTTGVPAPGADANAPVGPGTNPRPPIPSGTVAAQPATDGMGEMAAPDADETYLETMGAGTYISSDYKQKVTWAVPQLGDCPYCYQNGHGADGSTHAAMDIVTPGGYGAPVATPVTGTVVCAGTGNGPGVEGFGCTYAPATAENGCLFEDQCGPSQLTLDVGGDGAGNQLLVNMIHLGGVAVAPGTTVNPGDVIGSQGSMGDMIHTHLEAYAICNGTYIYLDPTLVINGYYTQANACAGY